ncbi:MAG: helix-turn-helix domain-containing protein [Betaproteobacteria bacterium]
MAPSDSVTHRTGAQAGAAWLRNLRTSDIDIHANAQSDWVLGYEQLSRGRFSGDINHIQLPGVRLVHESMSCAVRQRGSLGRGQYGFAVALEQAEEFIFTGQRLDLASIMIGRSEDLDLSSPADFSLMAIVVDGVLLNALWTQMYQRSLSAWSDRQLVVRANPANIESLRISHLALMQHIQTDPSILLDERRLLPLRDDILTEWLATIPERICVPELKRLESRKRVVDRACAFMLHRPEDPPSILQVCSTIGSSPRKLEYCFQDVLGVSPMKYLRAVRLNAVRRDIKRNVDPVARVNEIAARWGFWNPSQFSSIYRRQFDELPSETHHRVMANAQ